MECPPQGLFIFQKTPHFFNSFFLLYPLGDGYTAKKTMGYRGTQVLRSLDRRFQILLELLLKAKPVNQPLLKIELKFEPRVLPHGE
jgi:hypothetical protein